MAQAAQIQCAYKVGDIIECRDSSGRGQSWHKAYVSSLAPYRGRPGYYIVWQPLPKESWQSQGGWTYEACMRPLSAAA